MQDQKLQASISLNKKEFSSGDTLTLTIHNNEPPLIGRKIVFGQDYTIEYLQEGKWVEARWLYPGIWLDIAYVLMPGEAFDQYIKLFPVKKGTYRISKKVYAEGENPLVNEGITLVETFKVIKGTPEEEIPKAELPEEFWEELEDYCTKELPEGVTKRDVRMHLNDMISEAVGKVDPEHKTFISHGGGSQSVSIEVKHATKEFIEKWPDVCHGAVIEVNVFSWALTEKIETYREPMNLNLTNLTDDDVVRYAMMDDEFRRKYEGWEFKVNEKKLIYKDGERMLYVYGQAYKNDIVDHVWFYLNKNGWIEDLMVIHT